MEGDEGKKDLKEDEGKTEGDAGRTEGDEGMMEGDEGQGMDLEGDERTMEGDRDEGTESDEGTSESDEGTSEDDEEPLEGDERVLEADEGALEGDKGTTEGDEGKMEGDEGAADLEGDEGTMEPDEGVTDVKEEEDVDLEAIMSTAVVIAEDVIKGATDSFRELQMKEEAAKAKYKVKNIEWMRCADFTVARGVLQIEEYLKTWELHESWLHWTCYLNDEELKYTTQYHYRVCWSIPTCRKPIPRATASVYFVIEISKVKPATFPVEVFFMVETNKLIHRPGVSRFKEKWLKDVIESKVCMMETVDF
ncbi:hypothetical protein lerEdw1_010493 [Lerista edwardsae]|nr:hypothetical protein lerEdw1_010493 [Lerista edwardsae]